MHALVPGAGPSLDGQRWLTAKHPKHRRRRQAYLVDNVELSAEFRKVYLRGLKRLLRQGKLKLGGSVEFLNDSGKRQQWLDALQAIDWNVFIEGPPQDRSQPAHMVRYLSRYLTGGPIADSRLLSADQEEVHFLARPKRGEKLAKSKPLTRTRRNRMAQPVPRRLSGRSFMQRWCLHILPKGFTKTRWYGGYHGTNKSKYLQLCRQLLSISEEETAEQTEPADTTTARCCPHCEGDLKLVEQQRRPSWREVFEKLVYRDGVYSPLLYHFCSRAPP